VAQTSELYLMQHEGTPGGGRVDVVFEGTLDEIERRMDGWREVVGEWGSLRWLVERLGAGVPAHIVAAAGMNPAVAAQEPRFTRTVESDVA